LSPSFFFLLSLSALRGYVSHPTQRPKVLVGYITFWPCFFSVSPQPKPPTSSCSSLHFLRRITLQEGSLRGLAYMTWPAQFYRQVLIPDVSVRHSRPTLLSTLFPCQLGGYGVDIRIVVRIIVGERALSLRFSLFFLSFFDPIKAPLPL